MQKERHNRIERISEAGKSFLIFVLVVVMLFLLVLLALEQNVAGEEALPFDDRMIVYQSGASSFSHGMDVSRLSPAVMAWRKTEGGPMYGMTASPALAKAYPSLFVLLREVLGPGMTCRLLDEQTGAGLWEDCRKHSFLYLSYLTDLPGAVIRAYTVSDEDDADAADDVTAQGDAVYIREIFFLSGEDGGLFAVTRDADGRVARFRPSGELHMEPLSAYIDTVSTQAAGSASPAVFYGEAKQLFGNAQYQLVSDASCGTDTAMLLSDVRPYPVLSAAVPDPAVLLFDRDPGAESLLGGVLALLGMKDRDTGNYYTDTAGGRVYLNAGGRLTLAAGGTIRYAALAGGGLPVSEYLGYSSVSGSYSLAEYLRTADRLLTKLYALSPALCGGRAVPLLTDVSRQTGADGQDVVSVSYCYQYAGTPLLQPDGMYAPALTLTIRDARIHTLTLSMLSVTETGEDLLLLAPSVVLDALAAEQPQNPAAEGMLSMAYIPSGAERMQMEWVFRTSADGKGGRTR